MFGTLAEAYFAQDVEYLLFALSLGDAEVFQLEVYVFLDCKLVNEIEALEDETNASLAIACTVFLL